MRKYLFLITLIGCVKDKENLINKKLEFIPMQNNFQLIQGDKLLTYFYDQDNAYLLYFSEVLNQGYSLIAEDVKLGERFIILDKINRLDNFFVFLPDTVFLNMGVGDDLVSALYEMRGLKITKIASDDYKVAINPKEIISIGDRFYFKYRNDLAYLIQGEKSIHILQIMDGDFPLHYTDITEIRRVDADVLVVKVVVDDTNLWVLYKDDSFQIESSDPNI